MSEGDQSSLPPFPLDTLFGDILPHFQRDVQGIQTSVALLEALAPWTRGDVRTWDWVDALPPPPGPPLGTSIVDPNLVTRGSWRLALNRKQQRKQWDEYGDGSSGKEQPTFPSKAPPPCRGFTLVEVREFGTFGNFAMLRHACDFGLQLNLHEQLISGAAKAGRKDVLQIYLKEFRAQQLQNPQNPVAPKSRILYMAEANLASEGKLEQLKWFIKWCEFKAEDVKWAACNTLRASCENGHLETAKWLTENFNITTEEARSWSNYALRWSASNGHLDVVKWLVEHFKLTAEDIKSDSDKAIQLAEKNQHTEVVKYLKEKAEAK